MEAIAVCITAIICSVIIAGGINRAAFYFTTTVCTAIRELVREYRAKNSIDHRKDS